MNREQSNSSVVYEKRLVLKIFRRLEKGLNPELEIGAFLTAKTSFRNVPPSWVMLNISVGRKNGAGRSPGLCRNQGDAWQFTMKHLAEYYEKRGE